MGEENFRNSRAVIDRLMREYGTSLLRMCALYLKDVAFAQDAVQDTFLKAYRHWQDFRGDSAEKTWLVSIARNVCRDYLRTAWFRHHSRADMAALPEEAEEFVFPDDTVITEVMRLPVKYREVILLRYYQEMKLKDTAQALNLSVGKVRSRLDRANHMLRDRLKEWYDEEA